MPHRQRRAAVDPVFREIILQRRFRAGHRRIQFLRQAVHPDGSLSGRIFPRPLKQALKQSRRKRLLASVDGRKPDQLKFLLFIFPDLQISLRREIENHRSHVAIIDRSVNHVSDLRRRHPVRRVELDRLDDLRIPAEQIIQKDCNPSHQDRGSRPDLAIHRPRRRVHPVPFRQRRVHSQTAPFFEIRKAGRDRSAVAADLTGILFRKPALPVGAVIKPVRVRINLLRHRQLYGRLPDRRIPPGRKQIETERIFRPG